MAREFAGERDRRRRRCGRRLRRGLDGCGSRLRRGRLQGNAVRQSPPDQESRERRCRGRAGNGERAQPRRHHRPAVNLGRGTTDQRAGDAMLLARVGAEQRAVRDHVDDARHAAREAVQFRECAFGEEVARRAGHAQAVADVGERLFATQGFEVVASRDALRQLAQVRTLEHRAQFRLADQDDLQQLLRRGLEVGEQAHLLEHVGREVLRFVHHQHDAPAAAVRVEQEMREQVHQRLDAAGGLRRHVHLQLVADALQEFGGRHPRVQDQRDIAVGRELLQQAAQHRGLAGADLAGELDEAAGLADAVGQVRQRLRVALAEVEVARVRRDRERLFVQPEKASVHKYLCVTAGLRR